MSGIVPGAWVETRWGKAVVVSVTPHDHSLVPRVTRRGTYLPCEDDSCAEASMVYYRYKAFRYTHDAKEKITTREPDPLWVLNGDLTAGPDAVTFLRGPTRLSRTVVKMTGPYGRGTP